MKSLNIKWLLPFIGFLVFNTACNKVIDINLNDAAPQIIIEGNISSESGPYQVQISKTINFSDANIFLGVTGATVIISDITDEMQDTLTETSPGIYKTKNILGLIGHSYQLSVTAEGKTYTAISTIPSQVKLDTITFQKTNRFGKVHINSVVNFIDPAGIVNYYRFIQTINGVTKEGVHLFSDRLADGKVINQQINSDSLEVGNIVKIEMICLDKGAYDYFRTLRQVTGGNNFQSVSPSNPISNISNKALGYFSAHSTQRKQAVVK